MKINIHISDEDYDFIESAALSDAAKKRMLEGYSLPESEPWKDETFFELFCSIIFRSAIEEMREKCEKCRHYNEYGSKGKKCEKGNDIGVYQSAICGDWSK